jgi:transcription antitermination factor NusG
MQDNAALNWFAVHVKSRHEFAAAERLMGAGIEVFLPSVERLSKWTDRKKLVRFPLFPGYLFVHVLRDHRGILTVLKTKGVVRILGAVPGEPEPVPDEQVLSLKKVVEAKVPLDPYPYLKEGQRVRITSGPLAGVEGLLLEKAEKHTLFLSVDILQQGVTLTIGASDVEPIK